MKEIDNIEKIRAKNNRSWMDLLRLAYKLDPETTKIILKDILERDRAISAEVEKLIYG